MLLDGITHTPHLQSLLSQLSFQLCTECALSHLADLDPTASAEDASNGHVQLPRRREARARNSVSVVAYDGFTYTNA